MDRKIFFFLFSIFLFFSTASWAESPYWVKSLRERGGASVFLKGISLGEDGTVVLGGRIISDERFSFLANVSSEGVESLVFKLKIGENTFIPHSNFNDVLSLAGQDIFVSAYDYPEEDGSYAPFFVVKGEETAVYFLDRPCEGGACLHVLGGNYDTFHRYLIPAENGFYFVSSASVSADCGVSGIYVAFFNAENPAASWHKFFAPAYERRTCTEYDENNLCTAYDIDFPVSCGLTSHIPYFAAATVDGGGNLIVVGDLYIAYANQIGVNSNAAFIWSISPTGETNWLKVFALSGSNSLNFQKVLSIGENKVAVLGDVTLEGNKRFLLLIFNTETTAVVAQKLSTLSFSSAPQVLGASWAGEELVVTLFAGSRYLFLLDPENFEAAWYQSNSGVILRHFVPVSEGLLLGLSGSSVNNQLATLGLDGSFCQGAYTQGEGAFLTDTALSLSIIDYDDLPHPTNSGNTSYSVKLYEFSAGNYEVGALEYCETCSFSLESLCSEYSLRVDLSPETVSSCRVTDNFEEISCPGDCEAYYRANTLVTLSASCEEEGDYEFLGWEGDCTGDGTCSLTMDEDHEVTARFSCKTIEAPQNLTANPSSLAAGESFVLSWNEVEGASSYRVYRCGGDSFDPEACQYETETTETNVTLRAELPEEMMAITWYYFVVASRSCGSTATSDPVAVSVTVPLPTYYGLMVEIVPEGSGTVTAEGLSCPGDCSEDYEAGTEVTLVANPAEGYVFSGWAGDCAACEGPTCTLVMDSDKTCTAQFEEVVSEPQPDLVVTKLVAPRYWRYGRKVRVTVLIENRGEADVTEPFVVRLFANPVAYEVELGEVTVNGLRAGARKLVRFRFRVEDDLCFPDNHHVLHAVVDGDDTVAESNEENNEATKNIIIRGCPETY